jgi:hypothetical protein
MREERLDEPHASELPRSRAGSMQAAQDTVEQHDGAVRSQRVELGAGERARAVRPERDQREVVVALVVLFLATANATESGSTSNASSSRAIGPRWPRHDSTITTVGTVMRSPRRFAALTIVALAR